MISVLSIACAKDIGYAFHISNKTPYQNEAIFLDVNISQENHSSVMLFKFNLKQSKAYTFHQVDFKENDKYHDLKHQYRYLIYPKKEGNIALEFEMIKSLTDDDKVAYAISGDRDNIKGLVKKDIAVAIEPLKLLVKPLPKGTKLVGDFKLSYELDKTSTDAYDPVHLKVVLKGKGDIPTFSLLPKSALYHLFTQKPKVKLLHHSKGTTANAEWNYAISAKESFVLPEVRLKGFNPKTKKSYELLVPAQSIEVNAVEVGSLVDKEDTPASSKGIDWSWIGWLFSYLAVFMAGVFMPRDLLKKRVKPKKSDNEILAEKMASVKTHKELLKLLLSLNDSKYREAVSLLEGVVYGSKKTSLGTIKRML